MIINIQNRKITKNMNTSKIYLVLVISIISLIITSTVLFNKLKAEKAEKELYKRNTNTLLRSIKSYKLKDSLNVTSIGMIELKLSEYKKYRSEDLKFINNLKVDKKRLEQITTTQMQTIYSLKGYVRDSIVYMNNVIKDTLRCISIKNKWLDVNGCVNKLNEFTGKIESRDSLFYVEHIVPHKFLFFKWGVKDRRQEIVSKNPNSKIIGAEFITIRK